MPIYEFQCNQCKKISEELCSIGTELHPAGCITCLAPMYRIPSAPQGIVQGSTAPSKIRSTVRVEVNEQQDFSACAPTHLDDNGNQQIFDQKTASSDTGISGTEKTLTSHTITPAEKH